MRTRIEGALSIAAVAVFLSIGSPAVSQTKKPTTLAELAAYTGADREQLLFGRARSEGKSRLVHIIGRGVIRRTHESLRSDVSRRRGGSL